MVVTCYVDGCNSGYESCEKIYFFKPKDEKVLNEWQKLIGKQNADLKKHHTVCHKHFEDADLIKQKIYNGKDGPIVMYDLNRWKLSDGALPKLRTGKPAQNGLPVPDGEELNVLSEIQNAVQPDYHTLDTCRIPEQHTLNPKEICLPVSWFWQEGSSVEEEFICSKFKWLNESKFEYTKTIIINRNRRTARYFVRGQQVSYENLKSQFESLEELATYVKTFDNVQDNVTSKFPNMANKNISKSICAPIDRQIIVQPIVETNIQKRPSNPSKKTNGDMPIQHSNQNVSENDGDPKFTSILMDHTYGMAPDKPSTLIRLPCQTLCERNSAVVAETVIPSDDWTLPPTDDRAAFTLEYPHEFFSTCVSKPKELEQVLIKHPSSNEDVNSTYSLALYHLETWCLGVYSPFKFESVNPTDIVKHRARPSKVTGKTTAKKGMDLHRSSLLVAQPVRSYRRSKTLLPSVSDQPRQSASKVTKTINSKSSKGISNDRQDPSISESWSYSLSENTEKEEEDSDLALAKGFLAKVYLRRKRLNKRIRQYSAKLSKSKDIARAILMAAKKFEMKKQELDVPDKPKKPARKAGPRTPCNQCGKAIMVSRMKSHLKTHSEKKSHLCELCGRVFAFKSSLNSHRQFHHDGLARPKPFKCSTCDFSCWVKTQLKRHEWIHTGEKPYDCKYCDKKFRQKGALVYHIRTHTGERPHLCNVCGASFTGRHTYVKHYKRKHTEKEPQTEKLPRRKRTSNGPVYSCEFCQKKFHRLLTYETHRSTHTGVTAAIRCRQAGCEFTYSDLGQLRNHMLEKHPEKAYVCNACKKVFLTKKNLILHQSAHDASLGFQCAYCPVRVTSKDGLIAHEKLHTRETPHECSVCKMRFHSTYTLQIHVRTHQPNYVKRKRQKKDPVEK